MAVLSIYTRDTYLTWINGGGLQTAPTALWIVLRSTAGGTTDASSRETITFTLDAANNKLDSNNAIQFANHTGGTVTLDRWAIYDNGTANTGNEIAAGNLDSSLQVSNGDKVRIDAGSVIISEGTSDLADSYAESLLLWINGSDLTGTITLNVEILDTAVSRGDQPCPCTLTSSILENTNTVTFGTAPGAGTIDTVRFHDGTNTISSKTASIPYANGDDLISNPQALRLTVI